MPLYEQWGLFTVTVTSVEKAPVPRFKREEGRETDVNTVPLNASAPIKDSDNGRDTAVNPVFLNASSPIYCNLL